MKDILFVMAIALTVSIVGLTTIHVSIDSSKSPQDEQMELIHESIIEDCSYIINNGEEQYLSEFKEIVHEHFETEVANAVLELVSDSIKQCE